MNSYLSLSLNMNRILHIFLLHIDLITTTTTNEKKGDKNSITLFGQSAGSSAVHLFTLIPQTRNLYRRAIASSGSMLNPWSYQKKNHTEILQKLIADEQSVVKESISLNDIIEYLKNTDGQSFGEKTFAPVYESGKSIKEIDLVWAPTIERMQK